MMRHLVTVKEYQKTVNTIEPSESIAVVEDMEIMMAYIEMHVI